MGEEGTDPAAEIDVGAAETDVGAAETDTAADDERPTVLVVDDEEGLAALYADWLEGQYEVLIAHSGREALDIVDPSVDVVLLDRRLGGISGDEVLAEMRDRGFECWVAMVTALDPDLDIVEMPFDAYLVKPVDREGVVGVVENLLTRSRFDTEVREYYRAVSKLAALRSERFSDLPHATDEIAELEAKIAELEERLDDRQTELDDVEAFSTVMRGREFSGGDS